MPSSTSPDETGYADLRTQMVRYLVEETGDARTPAVIDALSTVPRHLVVDQADDAEPAHTYNAEAVVVTKRDADGKGLSSVSAARIQAMQLEQARLQPGHRVLEIGSGGVNAAYLAEIVGPNGLVVTLDIDPDVTSRAQRFLSATGHDEVLVITGDGAEGAPGYAPFDRILVTVEATDIPPAWWNQLTEDGVIVAPLRMGGMTRTVSLTRDAVDPSLLSSDDLQLCGFVPMQGSGANAEIEVVLDDTADTRVSLRFDGTPDEPFDRAGLAAALHGPRVEQSTGVPIGATESPDHLDLWLATSLDPVLTMTPTRGAIDAGIVAGAIPFNTPALVIGPSFAYRVFRPTDEPGVYEIVVVAHGPERETVAGRFADEVIAWGRERPTAATLEVTRQDPPSSGPQWADTAQRTRTIRRPHTLVTISWPQPAASGRES